MDVILKKFSSFSENCLLPSPLPVLRTFHSPTACVRSIICPLWAYIRRHRLRIRWPPKWTSKSIHSFRARSAANKWNGTTKPIPIYKIINIINMNIRTTMTTYIYIFFFNCSTFIRFVLELRFRCFFFSFFSYFLVVVARDFNANNQLRFMRCAEWTEPPYIFVCVCACRRTFSRNKSRPAINIEFWHRLIMLYLLCAYDRLCASSSFLSPEMRARV